MKLLPAILLTAVVGSAPAFEPTPAPTPPAVRAAAAIPAGFVWIEGESATQSDAKRHGWYDSVRTNELSGGAWLSNFNSKQPATASYPFKLDQKGSYHLWLRANPTQAGISYRIDGRDWTSIDTRRAEQKLNIATDGKPDLRFIGWINAGKVALESGSRTLELRMESKNGNHGGIDAIVLSREPFTPNGKLKPGETTGRAEPGKWAFEPAPDPLSPGALLDLRYLNPMPAGKHGFVRLSPDGESFVDGRGEPIRFWAGTTYVAENKAPVEEIARWGNFHAKRGVNMVRFHGNLSGKDGEFAKTDEDQLDTVWRLVAGMKQAGIYTTISPYWGSHTKVPKHWKGPETGGDSLTGMLFFDPTTQAAYKSWLRDLFTRTNPYTGIALKDDPAFAIFQIQNEDSLLFWTEQNIKGAARRMLGKLFGNFLIEKHGSLEAAKSAWGGASMKEDDFAEGVVGLHIIWRLTQPRGKDQARLDDQLEFYARTMHEFNAMVESFIRDELGASQLINAGNWKTADNLTMLDSERWSYTANDVSGVNSYVSSFHQGEGNGYSIRKGHRFVNESALRNFGKLATNIKQPAGQPMIISESLWVPPNRYQAEGPLATAAYQSLTGVDAFYWFTLGRGFDSQFNKWSANTPTQLGVFPAAALIYRNHYLKQGKPVVHERRALENLWQQRSPIISETPGFDPNRDSGDLPKEAPVGKGVDPRAFLVGPVKVSYDADPAKSQIADLTPHIDDAKGIVRGNTGEVELDTQQGIITINAAKAKSVSGFLTEASPFLLGGVHIESSNEYASISVVSLDGADLDTSGHILIQAATTSRPYGFKTKPVKARTKHESFEALEITDLGSNPINLELIQATVTIDNPSLARAWVLDANGYVRDELEIQRKGGAITIPLPDDALYVVLRSK